MTKNNFKKSLKENFTNVEYFSFLNNEDDSTDFFHKKYLSKVFKNLDEIASNVNASKEDIKTAQTTILIFYKKLLQLISNGEQIQEEKEESVEEENNSLQKYITQNTDQAIAKSLTTLLDEPYNAGNNTKHRGVQLGLDAINSLLASSKFNKKINNLLYELPFYFNADFNQIQFLEYLMNYISNVKYFTDYAHSKKISKALKNKNKLIKYVQNLKDENSLVNNKRAMTMLKTSSRNQVDLINIADKKAGIMITVNSILLTILIPMLASYIFDYSKFIIPLTILIVTCSITIILATLATKPTSKNGEIEEDLASGRKSIFHFKNFSRINKDQFIDGVKTIISKENTFENAVLVDLYDVGIDLSRKYLQLKWCYTVFACGIALTMIGLFICLMQ